MIEIRKPKRNRRSSAEVASLILSAALIEFEKHGYAGAKTAAIARRAHVTEAQIFRLYPSKQALFQSAIFNPLSNHISKFLAENAVGILDAREAEIAYINSLQDFMGDNARQILALIMATASQSDPSQRDSIVDGLQSYFDHGAQVMSSRIGDDAKIDPKLMVRVSFAAVLGNMLIKDWLFPAEMASDEAIRKAIGDFVIDGLRANPTRI